MAEMIGAALILGLITSVLIKVFAKWNDAVPGILTANGLSLFIATVAAGFGKAIGPQPVFAEAFASYVVPQLVILGLTLWRWYKTQDKVIVPSPTSVAASPTANIPAPAPHPSAGATPIVERVQAIPATSRSSRDDLPPIPGLGPLPPPSKKKPWWKNTLAFILSLLVMAIAGVIGKEFGKEAYKAATRPSETSIHDALVKGLEEHRKTLPRKLDEGTTLIDAYVDKLRVTYVHEIGAEYEVTNLGAIEQSTKSKVCNAESMKNSMKAGVSYAYEYWGTAPTKRFWGRFIITSCP